MKNTTRMSLRSALYTVLLSSSTMLVAADRGGEVPVPKVIATSPGTIDQRAHAKPPGDRVILSDAQLDVIKAGDIGVQFAGGVEVELLPGIK